MNTPEIRIAEIRAREEALLADGFAEFGSSGVVYRRDVMIELLLQEENHIGDAPLQAADYALTPISADAALLTYRTWRTQPDGSERHVLRSSIWKHD